MPRRHPGSTTTKIFSTAKYQRPAHDSVTSGSLSRKSPRRVQRAPRRARHGPSVASIARWQIHFDCHHRRRARLVPARSFLSKAQPSSANSPRQAAAAPAPRGPWMASGRTSIFLWARARTSGACAIPTASSSKSRKAPPRRKICSWRLTENLWSPPSAPRSTPRIFTIRTATRRSATAARFTRSFPTTERNLTS